MPCPVCSAPCVCLPAQLPCSISNRHAPCAALACAPLWPAPLLLLVGTRRHDSTHCFRLHPISHARSVHAHAEQRASTETQASQPARSYGHGSRKSTGRWQEKWFQSILACRPKAGSDAHAVVNCCNHRNGGPICPAPPAPLALTPAWMQSIRATAPCPRTATSCSRHAAAAANDRLPCSLAMQKQPWQPIRSSSTPAMDTWAMHLEFVQICSRTLRKGPQPKKITTTPTKIVPFHPDLSFTCTTTTTCSTAKPTCSP